MMKSPTLTTGAVVTGLLAHRTEWVRRHEESVEALPDGSARHRVTVAFQVPESALAAVPRGSPVLVPLDVRPKGAAGDVDVRDEQGVAVPLLPDTWSAEIATAGLAALAQVGGADAGDLRLLSLAWRVADGSPSDAHLAIETIARGDAEVTRRAWSHAPFRVAAETLAEQRILLVALREAERERTLTYTYEERPVAAPERSRPG